MELRTLSQIKKLAAGCDVGWKIYKVVIIAVPLSLQEKKRAGIPR